jgi:hypothetical protein
MKKQLSLWLVSFYAEFIALLLNSFLGLLFWPSLKSGGGGLWPFPATLTVVSWFSVSLRAGGGRGGCSRMWEFGPCKLSWQAPGCVPSWLVSWASAFFCGLYYSERDFQATFLTDHEENEEKRFELPPTSFTVKLSPGTWLSDPLTILFFNNQLLVF